MGSTSPTFISSEAPLTLILTLLEQRYLLAEGLEGGEGRLGQVGVKEGGPGEVGG